MSDKPRDWWIEFSGDPKKDSDRELRYVSGKKPEGLDPSDEAIHVVEKSAYDALAAENERLREALKFYAEGNHIEDLKMDLENPSGEPTNWVCDSDDKFNLENGGVAREALEK